MVQTKLHCVNEEIALLQDAAHAETKSAMGDKYETSREMTAIELEKLNGQKIQYLNQLKTLNQIVKINPTNTVQPGSLVSTTIGEYFVALPLGSVDVEGRTVMVISPISPIAQLLIDKSEGVRLEFRGRPFEIRKIY